MPTSRRNFLRTSGMVIMGASGFYTVEQWLAAQDSGPGDDPYDYHSGGKGDWRQKPTLVTIFLRGGADSLHAFVPAGDDLYYRYRPRIAIPRRGEGGVVPFGRSTYWGLNPFLADLLPLFEEGRAVPIFNVGSPHETRSHFSAQDYMERAAPGNDTMKHGWLNRYLHATRTPFDPPLRGLSALNLLPRALRGPYPVLAGNNRTEHLDLFENLYAPTNLVGMTARPDAQAQQGSRLEDRPGRGDSAVQGVRTADAARDIITESGTSAVQRLRALEKAAATPTNAQYPQGPLGRQLQTIAKVIKAGVGLEVAQADYGGWDHHRGQGGPEGRMSQMLGHLSQCLVAFHEDLGARIDKVLVLVMSEFGRTVYENGSLGTDHGRGGFMLAVGGMLEGGRTFGRHTDLADLASGRFQPVHTDFRTVFSESLAKLFAVDPIEKGIFPGFHASAADHLGFLQPVGEG